MTYSRGLVSYIVGATMVVLGVLFLLEQAFGFDLLRYSWPFFIIIPGLLFFVGMVLGGRAAAVLALPGAVVTTVGLILLYQTMSDHWESWAYAWALIFPTAVGVGLYIQGTWSDQHDLARQGLRWARLGVVIFVIGGVFFELVIGFGRGSVGRILWPLLLIAVGAYLLRQGQPGPRAEPPWRASGGFPPPDGPDLSGSPVPVGSSPAAPVAEQVPPPTGPRPGRPPEPGVPEPNLPPQPTIPRPEPPSPEPRPGEPPRDEPDDEEEPL